MSEVVVALLRVLDRPVLGVGVCEQHTVGHVLTAPCGQVLLPKTVGPAKKSQCPPDQIVFSLGLIRGLAGGKAGEYACVVAVELQEIGIAYRP